MGKTKTAWPMQPRGFALAVGWIALGVILAAQPARAQEDAGGAEGDTGVVADEAEPVQPADSQPTEGADAAGPTAEPREGRNYLEWAFDSLGWGYSLVFLALSFTLVALFVMNVLAARRENVVPPDLIESFEAQLNAKQYQAAYELAKSDESFLGKVLSAGLAKLSAGYGPAIEAMQEVGQDEDMRLEHRLSYMALIGSISPMIGLLGTVQGMIASFRVIEETTGAPDPKLLAAGIATALFTTLIGLFIAIPAIGAYGILRNRVARLVLEVGIVSENLMSRFQTVGGKQVEEG